MSANDTGSTANADNTTTYTFACNIHMQSYLIAIAVGDLEEQNIGTGVRNDTFVNVITEPGFMKNVTDEFANLGAVF
jgi:aminopeptidase N